jgi:hypothetical protein
MDAKLESVIQSIIDKCYSDQKEVFNEFRREIYDQVSNDQSKASRIEPTIGAGDGIGYIPEIITVVSLVVNFIITTKLSKLTLEAKRIEIEKLKLELELKKIESEKVNEVERLILREYV